MVRLLIFMIPFFIGLGMAAWRLYTFKDRLKALRSSLPDPNDPRIKALLDAENSLDQETAALNRAAEQNQPPAAAAPADPLAPADAPAPEPPRAPPRRIL